MLFATKLPDRHRAGCRCQALFGGLFVFSFALATAANVTWDGTGNNDSNWSTKQNWGNVNVASGDSLFFSGSNRLANTNDLAGFSFAGITFNSGAGAFSLAGNSFTLTGAITNNSVNLQSIGNAIALSSGSHVVNAANGDISLFGSLSGAGSLTKSGSGILTLSGSNTYSGGTAINAGILAINSSGSLGASGTISFGGGALRYSSANTSDYSSRFSSAAGQQYKVDTNGQNVTWATGLTSSTGSLIKTGGGVLTLSNTSVSSYTGSTFVSGGSLLVNGSLGNTDVTVENTAELRGTGSLSGSVTINSGGTLASGSVVGVSTGTMTIDGNLSLQSGSTWEVDISTPLSFDKIVGVNDANFSGTLKVLLGYSPIEGDVFDLMDFSGAFLDSPMFDFSAAPLASGLSWNADNFSIDGTIRVVAVPEPSFATLGCGAFLFPLLRRRR
jgi:autotransporter-associated beta strand protein